MTTLNFHESWTCLHILQQLLLRKKVSDHHLHYQECDNIIFFVGEAPSDAVNDDDNLDNRGEEKLKKQLSNEGEGKSKEEDKKTPGDEPGEGVSTKYRLRGIVVHSGQASGGHYYSFIQIRYGIFYMEFNESLK